MGSYIRIIFLLVLALAACQTQTDSPTPQATSEATAEATQSPVAPAETSAAELDASPTATEEPASVETPESDIVSAIGAGEIYIAVSTLLEADSVPPAPQDAPEGFRWVVISATLANQSDAPIDVAPSQLIIIDAEENRYTALSDDSSLTPQLVGITLESGDSVMGFARFAIPVSAVPQLVEWCLDADCASKLQADVP